MIWEDILSTHPKDMLALQMLFFTHLTTGRRRGLRDCVTRVAKHHRPGESRSGKIFLILSIFWQNVAGVSFVSTTVFALILLLFILGYLLQLGVCCCCCCFCCCCCCCFQLVELSICNQKNIPPSLSGTMATSRASSASATSRTCSSTWRRRRGRGVWYERTQHKLK